MSHKRYKLTVERQIIIFIEIIQEIPPGHLQFPMLRKTLTWHRCNRNA